MTARTCFQRNARPQFFSPADLAIEAALDELSQNLTRLPENKNGEELVRANMAQGVFRIMCFNRDDYGNIDGPLQKVLTINYGDDQRAATWQCYFLRDTESRNQVNNHNRITPSADTPEGWCKLVTDWAGEVYGTAVIPPTPRPKFQNNI